MSSSASTSFTMDRNAIAALTNADQMVGQGTRRAAEKTTERARSALDSYGRVDSGRMRASLDFEIDYGGEEVSALVGSSVAYALYQHQGTRYIRPAPFLTDALAQLTPADFGGNG